MTLSAIWRAASIIRASASSLPSAHASAGARPYRTGGAVPPDSPDLGCTHVAEQRSGSVGEAEPKVRLDLLTFGRKQRLGAALPGIGGLHQRPG
jgi:hypothetical protein